MNSSQTAAQLLHLADLHERAIVRLETVCKIFHFQGAMVRESEANAGFSLAMAARSRSSFRPASEKTTSPDPSMRIKYGIPWSGNCLITSVVAWKLGHGSLR